MIWGRPYHQHQQLPPCYCRLWQGEKLPSRRKRSTFQPSIFRCQESKKSVQWGVILKIVSKVDFCEWKPCCFQPGVSRNCSNSRWFGETMNFFFQEKHVKLAFMSFWIPKETDFRSRKCYLKYHNSIGKGNFKQKSQRNFDRNIWVILWPLGHSLGSIS